MNPMMLSWLRPAANVLFLLLVFWAGYEWRDRSADAEVAQLTADFASERTAAALKQTAAVEKARTEERRVAFRIMETLDHEHLRRKASEAARRRADAAVGGLRGELEAARAAAREAADSPTAQSCRAAAATASMCSQLLGQCFERRRELAQFAEDVAGAAGVCVGSYRAVSGEPPDGPPQ